MLSKDEFNLLHQIYYGNSFTIDKLNSLSLEKLETLVCLRDKDFICLNSKSNMFIITPNGLNELNYKWEFILNGYH